MDVVAGVDIGNSTTEIVLCQGTMPIAWDRRPTRGTKGSEAAAVAASALLRQLVRRTQVTVREVAVAPWSPVDSRTTTITEPLPDTGRLTLVPHAQASVVGNAAAVGRPWRVDQAAPEGSLIALVPPGFGFAAAADAIEANPMVNGVLVADDEAVLIANRLRRELPIVDDVEIESAQLAALLLLEVRPTGAKVQIAADLWALQNALGLTEADQVGTANAAKWCSTERTAVLALNVPKGVVSSHRAVVKTNKDLELDAFAALQEVAKQPVGWLRIDPEGQLVDDIWLADIAVSSSKVHAVALATLRSELEVTQSDLDAIFDLPVRIGGSEPHAAAIGARSTPGAPTDAAVLDIGGGTIDLIFKDQSTTAAGAGDLLTAAVAESLAISRGAADWVKRGPAVRIEAPSVQLAEDGARTFLTQPMTAGLVGQLVAPGPATPLAFGAGIQPADWRMRRLALKSAVLAQNVARVISSAGFGPLSLILVGGPVADEELLATLHGTAGVAGLGRANVAGTLGHRYAVAYGLAVACKQ